MGCSQSLFGITGRPTSGVKVEINAAWVTCPYCKQALKPQYLSIKQHFLQAHIKRDKMKISADICVVAMLLANNRGCNKAFETCKQDKKDRITKLLKDIVNVPNKNSESK